MKGGEKMKYLVDPISLGSITTGTCNCYGGSSYCSGQSGGCTGKAPPCTYSPPPTCDSKNPCCGAGGRGTQSLPPVIG